MPVATCEATELRLLAIPKDTERQKAHQAGNQLRRHGGDGTAKVLLGVNSRFRGSVKVEHQQRHGHGENTIAERCETLHTLTRDQVI